MQLLLDVVRALHGVVEIFEQQCQQDAEQQPEHQAAHQIPAHVRLVRAARNLGAINHRNVVAGDAAGDADFLVALQQAVVELAVGGHFALQDVVVDRAVLQVERFRLEQGHLLAQQGFLGQRRVVLGLDRRLDVVQLGRDLPVDLGHLRLQLFHLRIFRLVQAQFFLIRTLQHAALRLQGADRRVLQHFRGQCGADRHLRLAPARFGTDAGALRTGDRGIEFGEVLADQGLVVVDRENLFLLRKRDQLALGVLELLLQLGEPVFEVILGIRRRTEAALEIGGDEGFGNGIGDACRELRVRAVVVQCDQARFADRFDHQATGDDASEQAVVNRLCRLRGLCGRLGAAEQGTKQCTPG